MERETRIKEFSSQQMMTILSPALAKLTLPDATFDFLLDVGLPTIPIRSGKNVYFTPNQTAIVNLNDIRYLQIGYFNHKEMLHAQPICIREQTGEVYLDNSAYVDWDKEATEESTEVALYYMNLDIQSLLLYFIAFYENLIPLAEILKEWTELQQHGDPSRSEVRRAMKAIDTQKQQIAQSLDAELRAIDASALTLGDDRKIMPYWLEEYLKMRVSLGG